MTMDRYYAQGTVGLDGHIYMIGGYTSQNGGNDGTMETYGPNFSVQPTSGVPGDTITFSGSNFAANSTVSIYWGTVATGTLLFTEAADGSGNVGQTTFEVPADATLGASYLVTAVDNQSQYPVNVGFVVGEPTPTPSPTATPMPPLASSPPYWVTGISMRGTRNEGTAAVGGDGRIYVMGGCTTVGCYSSSVQAFDPATDTWASATAMPWTDMNLAATTGLDGRIYVVGGCDPWYQCPMGTAGVYDPSTNTWTALPSMPNPRQYLAATTGLDGRIYAIGGSTCGENTSCFTGDMDVLRPEHERVEHRPRPCPRHATCWARPRDPTDVSTPSVGAVTSVPTTRRRSTTRARTHGRRCCRCRRRDRS